MTDTISARAAIPGIKSPSPLVIGPKAREDWIGWQEDWGDYSIIQGIESKSTDMKLALFRTSLGPEGKKLLRNQPTPIKPDGTPMDINDLSTLIAMMKTDVLGEVNTTYERCVFRGRRHNQDETIEEFITEVILFFSSSNLFSSSSSLSSATTVTLSMAILCSLAILPHIRCAHTISILSEGCSTLNTYDFKNGGRR